MIMTKGGEHLHGSDALSIDIWSNYSDLTRPGPLKGSVWEGNTPKISGKSRLVKCYYLAINIYIYVSKKACFQTTNSFT